jgi:hypothetical protein
VTDSTFRVVRVDFDHNQLPATIHVETDRPTVTHVLNRAVDAAHLLTWAQNVPAAAPTYLVASSVQRSLSRIFDSHWYGGLDGYLAERQDTL